MRIKRRVLFPALMLFALFALCQGALAVQNDATPSPELAPKPSADVAAPVSGSDDMQRLQLRLFALGYRLEPVSGIADAAHEASLAAFCKESGLDAGATPSSISAALLAPDAIYASFHANAVSLGRSLSDAPFVAGLALDWNDVSQRLTTGTVYPLTSCTSGIAFRMRYVEGDGHAELSPELSWDDATLFSLLGGGQQRKMPVVLSIGSLHIAASIELNTIVPVQENGTHRYCLYFSGSTSHFPGIADAEHAYLIRYATQTDTVANADVPASSTTDAAIGVPVDSMDVANPSSSAQDKLPVDDSD